MSFLRHMASFLLCAAVGGPVLSACPNFHRIYGTIDLESKNWKTVSITTDKEKLCGEIPVAPKANLEFTFKKNDLTFSQKIFRSMVGFWDHPEKDGKFSGGTTKLKSLEVMTLLPDWYKGSTLTVTDIKTGKKILDTKL